MAPTASIEYLFTPADAEQYAAKLGIQDPNALTQHFTAPLVEVMNTQMLPFTLCAWICVGAVLYDGLLNMEQYEYRLIKNFKPINALYFVLKYFGTLSACMYAALSIMGRTGSCGDIIKVGTAAQAVGSIAGSGIFYARIAALTNHSKIAKIYFFLLGAIHPGVTFYLSSTAVGYDSPNDVPIVMCIFDQPRRDLVAVACFASFLFDISILGVTIYVLRRFQHSKMSGNSAANHLRWVLLRDNLLYVGLSSSFELVLAVLSLLTDLAITNLFILPFVLVANIILGCRVFIKLKFINSSKGVDSAVTGSDSYTQYVPPEDRSRLRRRHDERKAMKSNDEISISSYEEGIALDQMKETREMSNK